jgi:hypothetical protein
MPRTFSQLTRPLVTAALAAALVAAAAAPSAGAAAPKSGTWSGDLTQQLQFLPDKPYTTTFVISAWERRIQTVVGSLRMECPSVIGIQDVRILKSWKTGRGPKVSRRGTFAFKADGAYIHGRLSKSTAIGGASSSTQDPDCNGVGRFNAQRRH